MPSGTKPAAGVEGRKRFAETAARIPRELFACRAGGVRPGEVRQVQEVPAGLSPVVVPDHRRAREDRADAQDARL